MNNFVRTVGPTLAWMFVIFCLSTGAGGASHTNSFLDRILARLFPVWYAQWPWASRDALHLYVRKAAHISEYAILGAMMVRTVRGMNWVARKRAGTTAWALATAYASTDEFHQRFVPGRTPKVEDVVIDSVGAMLGVGIMAIIWRKNNTSGDKT